MPGFQFVRITTGANGLRIPAAAKCCLCNLLLDEGVCLSGCGHSACYLCQVRRPSLTCPLDGIKYKPNEYKPLPPDIDDWLYDTKLKCQWFDGYRCTATSIALRNVHRHEQVCPNRPSICSGNSFRHCGDSGVNAGSTQSTSFASESKMKNTPPLKPKPYKMFDTTKIEEWIKQLSKDVHKVNLNQSSDKRTGASNPNIEW